MASNFLLIADNPGVGVDLRAQLNSSGEYFSLAEATFNKAPEYLNSQKYDKVFFSLPSANKNREHYKKALVFVTALAKTFDVQAIDDFHADSSATQHLESRQISHISRAELQREPTSDILNTLVSYNIEERRERDRRSDIKNAEITKLHTELIKHEYRLNSLEEWEEKTGFYLHGGTTPDGKNRGIIAAVQQFWNCYEDFDTVQDTVKANSLEIKALIDEVSELKQTLKEKTGTNWQKQAIIWSVIAALLAAIIPNMIDAHSKALEKANSKTNIEVIK